MLEYPKKGSAEAFAWAKKMQKARIAAKIRKAGLAREAEHFGEDFARRSKKEFTAAQIRQAGKETEKEYFGEGGRLVKRNPKYKKNLVRVCAWCGRKLGEISPLADTRETHGICEECIATKLPSSRKMKKNPIAIYNPPQAEVAGIIYKNAIEIRAEKTGGDLRGFYKHTFGPNVQILGLTNGDVLLHHKYGKRLWISKKDYERSGMQHE